MTPWGSKQGICILNGPQMQPRVEITGCIPCLLFCCFSDGGGTQGLCHGGTPSPCVSFSYAALTQLGNSAANFPWQSSSGELQSGGTPSGSCLQTPNQKSVLEWLPGTGCRVRLRLCSRGGIRDGAVTHSHGSPQSPACPFHCAFSFSACWGRVIALLQAHETLPCGLTSGITRAPGNSDL